MTPHARSQPAGDWLQDLVSPGVGEATTLLARSYSGGAGGVLLLGGDIGALGVARSLGRRGIPVHFLPGPNPVAGFSRYAKTVAHWPGAEAEGAPVWLENYAHANGAEGWVLIPAGDSEVRLVTGNHARLSQVYRGDDATVGRDPLCRRQEPHLLSRRGLGDLPSAHLAAGQPRRSRTGRSCVLADPQAGDEGGCQRPHDGQGLAGR